MCKIDVTVVMCLYSIFIFSKSIMLLSIWLLLPCNFHFHYCKNHSVQQPLSSVKMCEIHQNLALPSGPWKAFGKESTHRKEPRKHTAKISDTAHSGQNRRWRTDHDKVFKNTQKNVNHGKLLGHVALLANLDGAFFIVISQGGMCRIGKCHS
jgi:hypothetical protein